ncbi:hypothetical protein [Carboxylicivirga sp. N1Y90]|uniref:hypothetical protein n=1 Tax=Carboxylicivirga fragile TaxID=3417571 RepID=UPI003D34AE59|nr:hypothetical protein [Marinilabiliaceae bacterium N1Y90]
MKNVVLIMLSLVIIVACGQKQNKKSVKETEPKALVLDVTQVLQNAVDNIDKEVVFRGWVSHVCKHSGRRCFIKSEDGSVSIRVEAGGKINGFNKELTGTQMKVQGILKVKKLSTQYMDEWQAKLEAQENDIEDGGEHCSAELDNINEMRDWMKEHNKDYYPIYYVNGIDYEVLGE